MSTASEFRGYGSRSKVDDVGQEETGCDLDLVQHEKSTSQFLGGCFSYVKRDNSWERTDTETGYESTIQDVSRALILRVINTHPTVIWARPKEATWIIIPIEN